jgi:hypothetical protein
MRWAISTFRETAGCCSTRGRIRGLSPHWASRAVRRPTAHRSPRVRRPLPAAQPTAASTRRTFRSPPTRARNGGRCTMRRSASSGRTSMTRGTTDLTWTEPSASTSAISPGWPAAPTWTTSSRKCSATSPWATCTCRRRVRIRPANLRRTACSAPTIPSQTAAGASRKSTRARTGTRFSPRPSPSPG